MKIETADFGTYQGATAGLEQGDRWEYPGIGYNATDGKFYIGEEEAKGLEFVPFAIRQCKEVIDANGVVHRYPIKTRRTEMVDGDIVNRVQVAGMVGDEMYIFGARSWTARAAWLNPRGGPYHDARFEVGIWYRLQDYIKTLKSDTGRTTAPFCWRLKLKAGEAIELASAANTKQKAKGCPIVAETLSFVGPERAVANEKLYVDEDLDEWVAEWNKTGVTESAPEPAANGNGRDLHVANDEEIPF